ncbi:ferrous iron transport protein B [Negativibacillus massiliensis]|uniref:ferrous iron transport protein B n=1 Tax=Negativibacillus massiliensis TaxID=1871035 RepID=UPI002A7F2E13|nr:ferrous iron transport protein B [Negativibacillus massiliensis]MDY4046971.1 ferrous iron transport protein B [Negativibacillus massiliensis]
MEYKIALAGNPNCGKTTMFNDLTGSSQYVGNWPGVTVEKKEGKLKSNKQAIIQDLPGIYSLSPYTLEEVVSRNYLVTQHPDAMINIVDASNLERNLYLTTQLLEIGVPMVIALNMMDLVRKNGDKIDVAKLSQALGCQIIETSALKGEGSAEVAKVALTLAQRKSLAPKPLSFDPKLEETLSMIQKQIAGSCDPNNLRWFAIKLFERDEKAMEQLNLSAAVLDQIEALRQEAEREFDDDAESIITHERYQAISRILKTCYQKQQAKQRLTTSDKIDKIVTNRILALPIFALVMFVVYYLSISTVGTMMTDWVNDVLFTEIIPPAVEGWLTAANTAPWLQSLVLDGIIAGVGAVLGFLPQMMVLFLLLALLEDCGYMARIAFIMDRVFRRFGLSGKSFIPMLVGLGCGVPAVQASRTIENDRDRKMTIMTTTFIPCSAKLPIIGLISGALFHGSGWVATSAYFVGIAAIIISGIILKKTKLFAGDPAPFVMELPAYHIPSVKGVLIHMWDRSKAFVRKAGTIIFLSSALIWFLSNFNFSLQMVETPDSILASIGRVIAPIFAPLGWGHWEAAVGSFAGLVAKENLVSVMAILYGFAEVAENGDEMWSVFAQNFTMISAYSFLVFNLLCAPCFAAIGAIRREMGSGKWTWIAIGYQCLFAYVVSLIIYQIGNLLLGGTFGLGTVVGIILLAAMVYLMVRPNPEERTRKLKVAKTAA